MAKVPRKPNINHLKTLDPELKIVPANSVVWRIYFRGGNHPTTWGGFRHVGPTDARFDHHLDTDPTDQGRAIVYAAADPVTCFAEVFQKHRVINRWHKEPWLVGFEVAQAVKLLDLTGSFPTRAGASMGLMTGPRSVSRKWARGFYEIYDEVDGLYYPSSMHANQPAIVFNDRAKNAGVIPIHPSFHRSLGDAAVLSLLKNTARSLGYVLN